MSARRGGRGRRRPPTRAAGLVAPSCLLVCVLPLAPPAAAGLSLVLARPSSVTTSTTFAGYRVQSPALSSASLIVKVPRLRCGSSNSVISTGVALVGGPGGLTVGDGVGVNIYSSCYRGATSYELELSAESRQSAPVFTIAAGQRLSVSAAAGSGKADVAVRDLSSGASWAETGDLPSPYRPSSVEIGDTLVMRSAAMGSTALPVPAFSGAEVDNVLVGGHPLGSLHPQAVDLTGTTGTVVSPTPLLGGENFSLVFSGPAPGQSPGAGPATANGNAQAVCPGSGTGSDRPLPKNSSLSFDDVTDQVAGGFGGIYAHIGPAPVCRDQRSNPPTSAWVMLQAGGTRYTGCGQSSYVFVQAGIFYSYPLDRPHSEHAFAEVGYPCLSGNGSKEFWTSTVTSGTFGVEDLGRSSSHANCPGAVVPAVGDTTGTAIDRVETTLDGKCLWVMDLPLRYLGLMHWANLAAEVHTHTALVPGTYRQPLVFSGAHVYYKGAWEDFVTNGSAGASSAPVPQRVVVDAGVNQGTGCQRQSGAGASWSVAMWAAGRTGSCSPA